MIYERVTIKGKCPSKSNSYKIVTIGGHGSLAKTPAIHEFERAFYYQCPLRDKMIKKPFKLSIDIFHENDRPDIDNGAKVCLDAMQQCKVIKNDRQCVELHMRKLIDKSNPRIEFVIEEIDI